MNTTAELITEFAKHTDATAERQKESVSNDTQRRNTNCRRGKIHVKGYTWRVDACIKVHLAK